LIVALFAVWLAVCLASGAAFAVAQLWLPTARWPLGYTVLACVSIDFRPRLQSGLTWILPQTKSVSAWSHLRGRCFRMPWLPLLPPSGSLSLPR
jgi:hypothetical protein